MSILKIAPGKRVEGILTLPGDKSISHRAALISSLARGESTIRNFSSAVDCLFTLECLQKLGIKVSWVEENTVCVEGKEKLNEPADILDAGNSGTTVRLLSGILASQNFLSVFTGDSSLRNRPMKRIIAPLRLMGAKLWAREDNFLPLAIKGGNLKAISYQSPLASAQVKSCVLLAGLKALGKTLYQEPVKSRDHTEKMLQYFQVPLLVDGLSISLEGPVGLEARDIFVPGDISTAAFFIVAACILPNSELIIEKVGVNPTRTGLIEKLQEMGAKITFSSQKVLNREEVAEIKIKSSPLKGFTLNRVSIPALIDEIPILAVAALFAEGESVIQGAEELRVKETDRIKAMTTNLRKLGAEVKELPDGMIIQPLTELKGGSVDSFGDHRIAMAMIIAGLKSKQGVEIHHPECIKISCPQFMELLKKVVRR
jgi:3-phosphoshikimate 1-carboxyvinyltransferase